MKLGIALLPLLAAACVTAQPPASDVHTISEVMERHQEFHRQPIAVSGVITECEGMDCALLAEGREVGDGLYLNVGGSDRFDRSVRGLAYRRVIISGTFDADCLHWRADETSDQHEGLICLDRVADIEGPVLRHVFQE